MVILTVPVPAFFWVLLATHVKRLHDRGESAWWLLAGFIPIVGPIWLVVELGILQGTREANQFGPAPGRNMRANHARLWAGILSYVIGTVCAVLSVAGIIRVVPTTWTDWR